MESSNLSTAFTSSSTAAVYARAYVFSPKRQKAAVTTQGESPMRVWVNDVSAFNRPSQGSGSDDTFDVDLKPGLERATGEGGEYR